MRNALVASLALLLVGCTTPSGESGRSFWRPSTWFRGDLPAQVAIEQSRADEARDNLLRSAQGQVVAASSALAQEDDPSQPVAAAADLLQGAGDDLDRALGPLSPSAEENSRSLGERLATAQGMALLEAQRELGKLRDRSVRDAERLIAAEAKIAELNEKLGVAYRNEGELADKYRKQQFFLWGSLIALAAACIIFPGLLSVVMFVAKRLRSTLSQVSRAVDEWKETNPDAAKELEDQLRRRMDEANKALVKTIRRENAAKIASEGP